MMTRKTASVLVALALAMTACGDDDTESAATTTTSADPTTTASTTSSSTTTTSEPDDGLAVTEVPDDITLEYVNEVLLAINGEVGDVTREALEMQTITADMQGRLEAVATEDYANATLGALVNELNGADAIRDDPGDVVITATRLAAATDTCIAVAADIDSNGLVDESTPVVQGAVSLALAEPGGPTAFRLDQFATSGESADQFCSS